MPATEPARTSAEACEHCGLPAPRGERFCCSGCATVWDILRDGGLEATYYPLYRRSLDGGEGRPPPSTGRGYSELDDLAFAALHYRPGTGRDADGLCAIDLYLEGVHCAACVWLVEKLPRLVDGAVEVRLDMRRSVARVRWAPDRVPLSKIARTLDTLGYPVRPYRGVERHALRQASDRALLVRIGVAGAIAGNVMLIAFALYGGMFHDMAPAHRAFLRWVSLLLAVPSVLWTGASFFRGGLASLRTGTLHMDLPVALALLAGLGWGTVNTVLATGEIYFDTVTLLVFLLLVGRWVQRKQQRRAADAAELLFSVAPQTARRVETDGRVREIPLEALVPGALVEVRPGDPIPADGAIETGSSTLDMAWLTGESRPVAVQEGGAAFAGTTNLTRPLRLRVTAVGEQTRVGQLMRLVEEQATRRAPIVRLADRLAGGFVAAVLALAVLTVGIWWHAGAHVAIENAVALLIVSCPCALGLATPLAVSVAIGRAARAGLLIKGGDALEALARPGLLLLDKTGTLTEGRMSLVRWAGDESARPLVRAAEQQSLHPIARALQRDLDDGTEVRHAETTHDIVGGGVHAVVDGRAVLVGAPLWVSARADALPGHLGAEMAAMIAEGSTPIAIAVDGVQVAVAGVGDTLRADARPTLRQLQAQGWTVALLSGDHPDVVRAVGAELGIPADRCHGGATPEDKLAAVRQARGLAEGGAGAPVVMVGDGVNDAAALAAATVGVAVHGGAETSLMAADVFVSGRPGMEPLRSLVRGARGTVRVIRRNLLFSLVYNVGGAALAISGIISPLWAAVLMPLSSLTVIGSSWRGAPSFEASPPTDPPGPGADIS